MAILGVQFVFSLVMFSFLQKLSPYFSFGQWLLCNKLVRFLYPTDEELKSLAGISTGVKGKVKRNDYKKMINNTKKDDSFTVPRNLPIQLDTVKVQAVDLLPLKYFTDFQWLMDFSLSSVIVYTLTEIYFAVASHKIEFNVSILWCLLTIGFCLRVLMSQTAMYFKAEEGGERILCITFGFFYLVLGMGVLVINDIVLEFGLEEGYNNFSGNAMEFLKHQGVESQGPLSFLTFKIVLAILCAFIGGILTFPGLRMAKLHLDSLKYAKESPFKQTILHMNFILPLFICLTWARPIARDVFCVRRYSGDPYLTDAAFDSIRLILVIFFFFVRLILLPIHLQSHLNMAHEKIEMMKKESGRINSLELQKTVARVFYYLCVVTLQYITPALLILFLTFLLKTLGDYSWSDVFGDKVKVLWSVRNVASGMSMTAPPANSTDSIANTAAQFSWAISNLRNVFTSVWYRGLLSFIMWWVCTSWFLSSVFGIMYYTQIEKV
ncbi:transmembrane protein 161B [Patella vulgata]|uniref:transmembrane protein 161B n=1 Tax=Patella vulgata TaxID=6465 RepID=UPI00217F7156|nr:transmembrane protein 161B [Patella vulgata]XP_055954538.1 transmembrane protein 161B [Patella vulgata]